MNENRIIHGHNIEVLKAMPDNCVDAIVTDPPYELGFMGKKWDGSGIAYNIELWRECLRVLKPGGHLLAFGGTRTYHRMAVAIEDAGFEIRDMLEWIYATGFPKSLNVGIAYDKLEKEEWLKIRNGFDNIEISCIFDAWKNNLNNVKIAEAQYLRQKTNLGQNTKQKNIVVENVHSRHQEQKNIQSDLSNAKFAEILSEKSQIEIGICIQKNDIAHGNVLVKDSQRNYDLIVSFVEQNLNEAQATNTKINIALKSVEAEIRQLQNLVKPVGQSQQNQNHNVLSIFTAQFDVKEWLKENTEVSLKADEAVKTLRGNKKYSSEEITSVLCAVLPSVLKLTILNQSKTFQSLDMSQKTECVSAINVIITEYTAENLISNTVDILKSKAYDKIMGREREDLGKQPNARESLGSIQLCKKNGSGRLTKGTSPYEGQGSALKPAHEPICMARKPLSEKTIVENVVKHGTGGLNIDGCRIPISKDDDVIAKNPHTQSKGTDAYEHNCYGKYRPTQPTNYADVAENSGRFPANVLVTDDALNDGVMTKSGKSKSYKPAYSGNSTTKFIRGVSTDQNQHGDNGSKSRYFDVDAWAKHHGIYQVPKASKRERNEGCEGLEEKHFKMRRFAEEGCDMSVLKNRMNSKSGKNNHPTVKPVHLMAYLISLVAPQPGMVVLDPFAGSGTTGVACVKMGRKYILIEQEAEHIEIINSRVTYAENTYNAGRLPLT